MCLLIWFNPLMSNNTTHEVSNPVMPLYKLLQHILLSNSTFSKLSGFILLLSISFFLNHLNTKFILIPERTYMPSIIYIVIVSGILINKDLSPAMPAAFFLLVAIDRLLELYRIEKLSYNSFDAGLLIGLASLFYFNIIFFLIFIWVALATLRQSYWREWVYPIMGVSVPYILMFSIYYLTDRDFNTINNIVKENFSSHVKINISIMQNITLGYMAFLIILASNHMIKSYPSTKILPRKAFNLFFMAFLISVVIGFFISFTSYDMVLIGGLPLSFLISHYFVTSRKTRRIEFIFDLLIIILIVSQLFKI